MLVRYDSHGSVLQCGTEISQISPEHCQEIRANLHSRYRCLLCIPSSDENRILLTLFREKMQLDESPAASRIINNSLEHNTKLDERLIESLMVALVKDYDLPMLRSFFDRFAPYDWPGVAGLEIVKSFAKALEVNADLAGGAIAWSMLQKLLESHDEHGRTPLLKAVQEGKAADVIEVLNVLKQNPALFVSIVCQHDDVGFNIPMRLAQLNNPEQLDEFLGICELMGGEEGGGLLLDAALTLQNSRGQTLMGVATGQRPLARFAIVEAMLSHTLYKADLLKKLLAEPESEWLALFCNVVGSGDRDKVEKVLLFINETCPSLLSPEDEQTIFPALCRAAVSAGLTGVRTLVEAAGKTSFSFCEAIITQIKQGVFGEVRHNVTSFLNGYTGIRQQIAREEIQRAKNAQHGTSIGVDLDNLLRPPARLSPAAMPEREAAWRDKAETLTKNILHIYQLPAAALGRQEPVEARVFKRWLGMTFQTRDARGSARGREEVERRVANVITYLHDELYEPMQRADEAEGKVLRDRLVKLMDILKAHGDTCADQAMTGLMLCEIAIKMDKVMGSSAYMREGGVISDADKIVAENAMMGVLLDLFKRQAIESALVPQIAGQAGAGEGLETYYYQLLTFAPVLGISDCVARDMQYHRFAARTDYRSDLRKLLAYFTPTNIRYFVSQGVFDAVRVSDNWQAMVRRHYPEEFRQILEDGSLPFEEQAIRCVELYERKAVEVLERLGVFRPTPAPVVAQSPDQTPSRI